MSSKPKETFDDAPYWYKKQIHGLLDDMMKSNPLMIYLEEKFAKNREEREKNKIEENSSV